MEAGTVNTLLPRAVATRALEISLGYAAAGTREEGGNNRGDQVEFFQQMLGGTRGDPWCADFVCTCLVKAYAQLKGLPADRERLPQYVPAVRARILPLSGSCMRLAMGARSRGMLRAPDFAPSPGDLVLFDFQRLGEPGHVGFVVSASPGGALQTVEGNTEPEGGGPGGVYRRERSRSGVYGFIHFG